MDQKSDADYSCPGYGRKQDIQPYDRIGMKRVKVYAATMGIKNRIGHQMVQIDHHSEHHVKPGSMPFGVKAYSCGYARYHQVEDKMNRRSEH